MIIIIIHAYNYMLERIVSVNDQHNCAYIILSEMIKSWANILSYHGNKLAQ